MNIGIGIDIVLPHSRISILLILNVVDFAPKKAPEFAFKKVLRLLLHAKQKVK